MNISLNGRLILMGCGKMGGAMLEGWLKAGVASNKIVGLDPKPPQEMADFIAKHKITLNPSIASIADAEVIILAVKPQLMAEVLLALLPLMKSKPLVLSIARPTDSLSQRRARNSETSFLVPIHRLGKPS